VGAGWKIFEEFEGVGLIFENMEKCRIWKKEDLGYKIRF